MKKVKTLAFALVLSMTVMICGCSKKAELISDEQAVEAIRNYCYTNIPDLESIADEGYPVYWEIVSGDNNEVVVLFRSYTGAEERYYIDRATGNATVTEFVPGITDEEVPTDESINVRDYLK